MTWVEILSKVVLILSRLHHFSLFWCLSDSFFWRLFGILTTPPKTFRYIFLCGNLQCLPCSDPRTLCTWQWDLISGNLFITISNQWQDNWKSTPTPITPQTIFSVLLGVQGSGVLLWYHAFIIIFILYISYSKIGHIYRTYEANARTNLYNPFVIY